MENLSKPIKLAIAGATLVVVALIAFLAYKIGTRGEEVSIAKEAEASMSASLNPNQGTAETPGLGNLETPPTNEVRELTLPTARTTDEPARSLDSSITAGNVVETLNYGEYGKYYTGSLDNYVSAFDNLSKQASEIRLETGWSGPYGTPAYSECGMFNSGEYFFCDTTTGYRLIGADQPKNPLVAVINIEGKEVPKEIYQRLGDPKFSHAEVEVDGVKFDAWVLDSELAK